MNDFGFYLVMTDPLVGYAKCAEAAVKAGVRMLQLRMKHVSRSEVLCEAREVRRVTSGTDTLFIVNDDPEVGAEAGADGVHVGQDHKDPGDIRERFPELKIIGLSTHSPQQVVIANKKPVDYIGVGPVYATPTKDIPDPTLGLDVMSRMIQLSCRPAVVIGGIDELRIGSVLKAGAKNFAVVRAVCRSADPYEAIRRILSAG
jgi:thiamine-phosphate pyrophosphorylase